MNCKKIKFSNEDQLNQHFIKDHQNIVHPEIIRLSELKPLNSAKIHNLINKVRKAKGENKYHVICINDDRSPSSDLKTVDRLRSVKYIGKGCLFRSIYHTACFLLVQT